MPPGAILTWTHYRRLLPLGTQAERRFYAREAAQAGWSVRDLEHHIKTDAFSQGTKQLPEPSDSASKSASDLRPRRGRLYTYRITDASAGADRLSIDLGLSVYHTPLFYGLDNPTPGQIVTTTRDLDAPEGYRFQAVQAARNRLYTYRASVERVIDGDTLWVRIDLGFRMWTRQKLRLRGIDTPELPGPEGQQARAFVQEAVNGVPFLVLTTTKPDKYDRYLADLFYLPGEADAEQINRTGIFLNRELMEKGLAARFGG